MKLKYDFLIAGSILIFFLNSCGSSMIPMKNNFYSNSKKLGIIYITDNIGIYKAGAQGLLDMAITPGDRFKEPLMIVDKTVNPTKQIESLFKENLISKNKDFIVLDYIYDPSNLGKFEQPEGSKIKYHKYDLRDLKNKGIDELLIINTKYGLLVSYYGMIETGKSGYCRIDTEIIDLNDNSIIQKSLIDASEKINGQWKTPPKYENLENAIGAAISATIVKEKSNLNN